MALGYDSTLYFLAFDHRDLIQEGMLGIHGMPTQDELETMRSAKRIIFEGLVEASQRGIEPSTVGVLVDEWLGADIPARAREHGFVVAMPVERSGQAELTFEYDDDFRAHIESFDLDFSKVLIRFNPEGDAALNTRQLDRLKSLSDWLHQHERKLICELLVLPTDEQLARVGGSSDRYDVELRPELMRRAIAVVQDAGIEVDVWKLEGLDERADAESVVEQARSGSERAHVACVLLGRGASDERVEHWLRTVASVDGFVGFAIGRSIWWKPVKEFLGGEVDRETGVDRIADNYLRMISVYEGAKVL